MDDIKIDDWVKRTSNPAYIGKGLDGSLPVPFE
jgi:hypothetical protein